MDKNQKTSDNLNQSSGPIHHPAYQPFASLPDDVVARVRADKQSKWERFFSILGATLLLGIAIYILIMLRVAGKTGSEFVALGLFITLVPALGAISLVNIVGLPIYLRRYRPVGKKLVLSVLLLILSIPIALYGLFIVYELAIVMPKESKERQSQMLKQAEQDRQKFAADNAKPEITKDEAIELLNTCQLKGFYYTDQTDEDRVGGTWGELSSTGIVLTKIDGKPHRISIADRLIAELVPIARAAQRKCGGPQFWHDGTYEQYKDGKWYFNNSVVNSGGTGVAKEEVLNALRNCKVDYFVGYSGDINLVKDTNTKSWLIRAEESTSGVELSNNAPLTYVFASKSMTAELQDVARQYRQTCYSQKKLYIAIDDWMETEYPAGKWTRVRQ